MSVNFVSFTYSFYIILAFSHEFLKLILQIILFFSYVFFNLRYRCWLGGVFPVAGRILCEWIRTSSQVIPSSHTLESWWWLFPFIRENHFLQKSFSVHKVINFSFTFSIVLISVCQCCGSESGSTCFWASRIWIRICQSEVWIWIRIRLRIWILLSPSKKVRKTFIPPALWLLFDFLSLKMIYKYLQKVMQNTF